MDNPLVSVIIPLYNAAPYIRETIASVVSQTYQKLEIIIVDDGSSDNSVAIANGIADDRIKIYHQRNNGVSSARNYGIEQAKGTYIQFLDADDLIEATKIETQIKTVIGRSKLPTFICSNWARVGHASTAKNISIETLHLPKVDNLPIGFIASDNFIPLMSGLILKDAIVKVGGFNTEMTHIEDVNLLIKVYGENPNFLLLETIKPLFYYRNVPNSASKQSTKAFYHGIYNNCKLVQQLFRLKKHPFLLENYLNVYLHSIIDNYHSLAKLAAAELRDYKIQDNSNLKFKILKILGPSFFKPFYALCSKTLLKNK